MSTGQGRSFSGAAVCNIPRKCNYVVASGGERSQEPICNTPPPPAIPTFTVFLYSLHIRVCIVPSTDLPHVASFALLLWQHYLYSRRF